MREDSAVEGFSAERRDRFQADLRKNASSLAQESGMSSFRKALAHFDLDILKRLGTVFVVDGLENLMFAHGYLLSASRIRHSDGQGFPVVGFGKGLFRSFGRKKCFGKTPELLTDLHRLELTGEIVFRRGFVQIFLKRIKHAWLRYKL